MRERKQNFPDTRMLSTTEAAAYCGMGCTALRQFGEKIGARRKFGKSLRFDKAVIDKYFDSLEPDTVLTDAE